MTTNTDYRLILTRKERMHQCLGGSDAQVGCDRQTALHQVVELRIRGSDELLAFTLDFSPTFSVFCSFTCSCSVWCSSSRMNRPSSSKKRCRRADKFAIIFCGIFPTIFSMSA